MKWLIPLIILMIVLIAGCTQTQQTSTKLSSEAISVLNVYYDNYLDWTSICKNGCLSYDNTGKPYSVPCGMLAEFDAVVNSNPGDFVYCSFIYEGNKTSWNVPHEILKEPLPIENIDYTKDNQITLCCSLKENSDEACKTAILPAKC